jgi:Family of unknown function (DUF5681)
VAEKAAKDQRGVRGRPFVAGQSGNPNGKPSGSRNRSTVAVDALLEGEALALGRKAIEMALRGDGMAMKLCLERVAPVRRGRPVRFSLDPIITAEDVTRALGAVLQATATGDLTPDEASPVANIMEAKRRSIEVVELEKRLAALEAAATQRGLR